MRWPWSRDDDDIDVQSLVDGLERLTVWDLGAQPDRVARTGTRTGETDPLIGRTPHGPGVGGTVALLQALPDADTRFDDLTISPPHATIARPVATPFEDPGIDAAARRKHQALQRVQSVVGEVDPLRQRDGFVELPGGRRLLMVYAHRRERAHPESASSVGLADRLPQADFLVLLLGDHDLVVPAQRLVDSWNQANGSSSTRPALILRRTMNGQFFARFGRNGPPISLDEYVGRYDLLVACNRAVTAISVPPNPGGHVPASPGRPQARLQAAR